MNISLKYKETDIWLILKYTKKTHFFTYSYLVSSIYTGIHVVDNVNITGNSNLKLYKKFYQNCNCLKENLPLDVLKGWSEVHTDNVLSPSALSGIVSCSSS